MRIQAESRSGADRALVVSSLIPMYGEGFRGHCVGIEREIEGDLHRGRKIDSQLVGEWCSRYDIEGIGQQ